MDWLSLMVWQRVDELLNTASMLYHVMRIGPSVTSLVAVLALEAKPDYFLVLSHHFWREFIEREKAFLLGRGRFIFPLPEVEMV